jgi:hypothetical protein
MLIDKAYYDYDYTYIEPKKKDEDYKPKSNEELQDVFSKRFGWGNIMAKSDENESKTDKVKQADNDSVKQAESMQGLMMSEL